jgi:hypothetical protein
MKRSMLCASLLAALAFNAHAGLVGDSVEASMIRTVDTGYGLGRITGYGLEAPFIVQDGLSDRQQYSGAFTLDVNDNSFTIQFLSFAGWQEGTLFRLSDLDFAPGASLTSVSVATNLTGYSLTWTADSIDLLLGGTQFTPSTYFTGTFATTPAVPEPSSMALLAMGLGAVGWAKRRKKQAEAA